MEGSREINEGTVVAFLILGGPPRVFSFLPDCVIAASSLLRALPVRRAVLCGSMPAEPLLPAVSPRVYTSWLILDIYVRRLEERERENFHVTSMADSCQVLFFLASGQGDTPLSAADTRDVLVYDGDRLNIL